MYQMPLGFFGIELDILSSHTYARNTHIKGSA